MLDNDWFGRRLGLSIGDEDAPSLYLFFFLVSYLHFFFGEDSSGVILVIFELGRLRRMDVFESSILHVQLCCFGLMLGVEVVFRRFIFSFFVESVLNARIHLIHIVLELFL